MDFGTTFLKNLSQSTFSAKLGRGCDIFITTKLVTRAIFLKFVKLKLVKPINNIFGREN